MFTGQSLKLEEGNKDLLTMPNMYTNDKAGIAYSQIKYV